MLGLVIPDAYATAIVGVLLAGVLSWLAYMVRQSSRTAELLGKAATRLDNLEGRVQRLEGWQDGVQFARAATAAEARQEVKKQ